MEEEKWIIRRNISPDLGGTKEPRNSHVSKNGTLCLHRNSIWDAENMKISFVLKPSPSTIEWVPWEGSSQTPIPDSTSRSQGDLESTHTRMASSLREEPRVSYENKTHFKTQHQTDGAAVSTWKGSWSTLMDQSTERWKDKLPRWRAGNWTALVPEAQCLMMPICYLTP